MNTEKGFTLIEVLVALAIMSMISIMAWQGLDSSLRGKKILEKNHQKISEKLNWVHQLDSDCESILKSESSDFPTIFYSGKELWILRYKKNSHGNTTQIVWYKQRGDSLVRSETNNVTDSNKIKILWMNILNQSASIENMSYFENILENIYKQDIEVFRTQGANDRGLQGMTIKWWFNGMKHPLQRACLIK